MLSVFAAAAISKIRNGVGRRLWCALHDVHDISDVFMRFRAQISAMVICERTNGRCDNGAKRGRPSLYIAPQLISARVRPTRPSESERARVDHHCDDNDIIIMMTTDARKRFLRRGGGGPRPGRKRIHDRGSHRIPCTFVRPGDRLVPSPPPPIKLREEQDFSNYFLLLL